MAGFVLGVTFSFAIIENVGYMARISVVFNSAMEKLGLQGKSVCSLLMSMGCNMAGVAGSRDNRQCRTAFSYDDLSVEHSLWFDALSGTNAGNGILRPCRCDRDYF